MTKFIWNYFKNYKLSLALVVFCSILTAFVNLMEPYLTAKFIDEILIDKDTTIFYNFILLLLTINILAIASNWLSTIISSKMRVILNNQIVEEVMSHVYKIRSEFIFKTDMVYLSKRLDQDSIDLIRFAVDTMSSLCVNFALLCMAFFLLWSIGIKWAIIFVIIAILHGIFYKSLEKIIFNRSTMMREAESRYFTTLSDILLYSYSIKLHSVYDEYLKKFRTAFEKNFKAVIDQVKIQFWFVTSSLNANAIFKVLIFFLGGLDVLNGDMSVGNFVALNGYYLLAMQSIAYFMNIGQDYQNNLAAYTRIMEIKNMPTETQGTKILKTINSIEVSKVNFSFGEQKILTDFDKSFKRGKIYCIVGRNGAGKSTLMNLICGMIRPISGEIFFDGEPLPNIDMIDVRKNLIAVVEQKDFLKNDKLSGGERRKISISTAFNKSADVLIMDEPDNNLDATAIAELIKKINFYKQNHITIIISHDDRILSIADEVVKF